MTHFVKYFNKILTNKNKGGIPTKIKKPPKTKYYTKNNVSTQYTHTYTHLLCSTYILSTWWKLKNIYIMHFTTLPVICSSVNTHTYLDDVSFFKDNMNPHRVSLWAFFFLKSLKKLFHYLKRNGGKVVQIDHYLVCTFFRTKQWRTRNNTV